MVNKTLMAILMAGTALTAQAAEHLHDESTATTDLRFTENSGLLNTVNAVGTFESGLTDNGMQLAKGQLSILSGTPSDIYEIIVKNGTDPVDTTYKNHPARSIRLSGREDPNDSLRVSVVTDDSTTEGALDPNGTLIKSGGKTTIPYQVIALDNVGDPQSVNPDTYTLKTVAVSWVE
ncbi:TPA: hypothetical protein U2R15_004167 [Klebsiella aerogenes]|nr:hypothetical protein [Klebsiella aerogenes]